ncbi:hypothetical protein MGU_10050 [Metarhizium guizhouense ARSEF 977]|uniref:LPXTG-domain-containing protein n=1 Tax=Metarhizium guizhouense (strain ARSEF 977) TaxID=1276136 RepID=A0A0B4GJG1_METGA|nr:hypothetical protein MGU_10050 [Metarhizium guizhouense ARSEF 977]
MKPFKDIAIFFLLSSMSLCLALQVTPASHCAIHCLDSPEGNEFKASSSNTNTSDISCRDLDYSTTEKGVKFRRCMDCLQTSKKVDNEESDLKWYIYNLRYTISTCLYAAPNAPLNGTVARQCNINTACSALKAALTSDDVKPNPNTTWQYCTSQDGAFMSPELSVCISCLQATEGEVYLSNFFTALQVGCKQQPQDGSLLGISGTVFSTSAINMTDPNAKPKDDGSSESLSPSAIAGIVIAVILIFLVALALLIVYFRREQARDAWDFCNYYPSHRGPPGSYAYHGPENSAMSQAYRRYYTGNAFSEKPQAAAGSAGEYYDRMEAQYQHSRNDGEKSESHGSSTTMNVHDAHLGHRGASLSRSEGYPTPARTPSPRVPPAKIRRSNSPDSFAIQQYLQAAEDCENLARNHSGPPGAPSNTRSSLASKFSFLSISSFSSKFRPKKTNRHLRISLPISTSVAARQEYEMQISGPVRRQDTRFYDQPIGSRVIYTAEPAPNIRPQEIYYDGYLEVPLRSGKSTLYGY